VKRGLRFALQGRPEEALPIPPEHWGLSVDAGGNLVLDGVPLSELGERSTSPLHVVSARRLRDNAQRFLSRPGGGTAGCEVFYSYKTNPLPGVLGELHSAGIGAEVISHYELWLAEKLGVPPDKIVYNGPAKSEDSVRAAIGLGIQLLNLNHREEIGVVARLARELGRKPRVGLRVTVGGGWTGQFGVSAEDGSALAAYEEALGTGALEVVGVHAHRGGMIRSEAELLPFVDGLLAFTERLFERFGLAPEILDFGGSLGLPSVRGLSPRELRLNRTFFRALTAPDPGSALSIERYVELLRSRVEDHYRARGRPMPRVFLEPGRALTGDAQLLLTRVLSVKDGGERQYAILDAGINLADSCRAEYHALLSVNRQGAPSSRIYTVVGPICTPGDTLYWAVALPELTPGDWLAIMDSGAYFVPFSTSFSFPRPAVVMVDQGQVRTLRRAERFADLIAYDDIRPLPRGGDS
jgi:diaminopimelate decarboxylase